jgi:hypothetical protein
LVQEFMPAIRAAHERQIPISIDELNSASCAGAVGASDTFAEALWSLEVAFELARAGADAIDFHSNNGTHYAAFLFQSSTGPGGIAYRVAVQPLYYGMLFFAQATQGGARWLPVTTDAGAPVKLWAMLDIHDIVRVAALNKDPGQPRDVSLELAPARGTGALVRLSAPALDAKSGITLGGRTFDGTTDGRPLGADGSERVPVDGSGRYAFTLPPATAALLTIDGAAAP